MVSSQTRDGTQPTQTKSRYRPEIDGLRALAVIAVIVNHINKAALPSGYLGVDIFFVISGFVITASLAGRQSANFIDFISGFYARRIKRLIPSLVLFVTVCSILICLFNPNPTASLTTGITALFGLSNIYLYSQAVDYFAAATELNVFTHTWSLGIEEQFYFLFPLIIWLTGFSQGRKRSARYLLFAIGALSTASLILFIYLYQQNQPAAYFLMPSRFWEVGVGCLLFLVLQQFKNLARVLGQVPPAIAIAGMIAVFFAPLEYAVSTTIGMVLITAILIASLRADTAVYRVLANDRVVFAGSLSYSLYLWHWGIISLSRWTIGLHWWSIPFQVLLMVLVAVLSHRYIETPLRHAKWSSLRWKTIGYGLAVSVCTAAAIAILRSPDVDLYTGRQPVLVAQGVRSLSDEYVFEAADSRWAGLECVLVNNDDVGKPIPVENCTLGNFSEAKTRVLVVGNSYSASFTQAFDQLVLADNYAVTITSSWGASPVPALPNQTIYDKASDYYWTSVIPGLTEQLQPGDWVFAANRFTNFAPPKSLARGLDSQLNRLENGLREFSSELASQGLRFAFLHIGSYGKAANCQPVIASKQWFSPFGGPCKLPSRKELLTRRAPLDDMLKRLESEGVLQVVDLVDIFCPGKQCTYEAENGQILYRDEYGHPSVEASRLSAPIIQNALTSP